MKTCSFTGHRPGNLPFGYDENHPQCRKLKVHLYNIIGTLAKNGVTDFYTGMALGTDTYCAEIVLYLQRKFFPDIRLHGVLPCANQEIKWKEKAQMRYKFLLQGCSTTYYISVPYTSGCMLERNDYLVEKASIILAVYDGKSTGGTAYTVKKGREKGKEMIIVNPFSFRI